LGDKPAGWVIPASVAELREVTPEWDLIVAAADSEKGVARAELLEACGL
jgi:hypothetical protein